MQFTVGVVSFLQGQHNGVIYHCNDGYFYHKHHDRDRPDNPFITLRCTRRKSTTNPCWGLAVMTRDGSHFECTRPHTHGPDVWNVEERFLRHSLISAVSSGDPQPFSLIIRNVGIRGGFSMEARARLTLDRMRTAMRTERMRLLPPIPDTLFELATYLSDPQFVNVSRTIDNTDNIFAGACGDFGAGTFSVVFMSQRQATHLMNAVAIFADGTFKKKPKKPHCGQMFVISCVWYNQQTTCKHIVTCARVLMQRRTTQAYIALLFFLRTLMPGWNPQTIMADHELAQVHAWIYVFPNAHITTCLFHFEVDVFRNAKSLGLEVHMRQSWAINTTVRSCAVLPLLPSNHIMYGLHAIGHWARIMGAMQNPLVRDLFSYLCRQWTPALQYLSVFGVEDRTNNVAESVHATLALEVRENGPNVWSLIDFRNWHKRPVINVDNILLFLKTNQDVDKWFKNILRKGKNIAINEKNVSLLPGAFKRLEDQTMIDLHGLQRGYRVGRPQQLKTLRNDARIRNLTESYLRNNINVVTFLVEASKCMEGAYNFVFN